MRRTTSLAAASISVTPSLTPTSPRSTANLRMKSISVQCGKCCNRVSEWSVKLSVLSLIPFNARNAGIARVPSGVSKNVLVSLVSLSTCKCLAAASLAQATASFVNGNIPPLLQLSTSGIWPWYPVG